MVRAHALVALGGLAHFEGDLTAAQRHYIESLALFREVQGNRGVATWLGGIAGVWNAQGQPERAARLFGAAEAHHALLTDAFRAKHKRDVRATRAALGEEAFAAAWAPGRQMSLEEAVSDALAGVLNAAEG
jgi:hypothetical protein